jgi:4-hydroxybenzoate polyprenyltransferase
MMEHTLFSLPLAGAALLLETSGRPAVSTLIWVFLAVFGARNGANALNRIIDRRIDEENPRTAGRDLPAGRVKSRDLWIFTIFCLILLTVSAFMLNPLCVVLLPVAAVLIGGYSFTKRFTFLCHYWLGVTCAAAVMGSFLAVTGRFELRFFPLTAAAALWVAGFDILYALQDIKHDREKGLHSVPARFGRTGGLIIAGLSHLGAAAAFFLTGYFYGLGLFYYLGIVAAVILMIAQNQIARLGSPDRIPFAAYRLNQILSPLVLTFTVLDIYLPGGLFHG